MDGYNEGLVDVQEEAPKVAAPASVAGGGGGRGGAEFGQVCAGAEVFTLAGEKDGVDTRVVSGGFQGLKEFVPHCGVEGILDVGSIEADEANGAAFVVDDGFWGRHFLVSG